METEYIQHETRKIVQFYYDHLVFFRYHTEREYQLPVVVYDPPIYILFKAEPKWSVAHAFDV